MTNTDTTDNVPKRYRCPRNGRNYPQVPTTTILHHLRQPWQWAPTAENYYFCSDPECAVVYFGHDDSVLEQSALRTPVGLKDPAGEALICYCFGVSRSEATDPTIKGFVQQQTRQGTCACRTRNPAGRCCLADFPAS